MRDRLIELFKQADEKAGEYIRKNDHMDFIPTKDELAGVYADHLLANGVIVPPCKVGDMVYEIQPIRQRVQSYEITTLKWNGYYWWFTWITKDHNGIYGNVEGFSNHQIGKTVFLTREEDGEGVGGGGGMRSVLISIQPRWCELIASGKKTVEVRKTKPKLETPFKVYIYETQGRTETPFVDEEGHHIFKGRGQVIGEFVCNKLLESFLNNNDGWFVEKGRLTKEEIDKYQGDNAILYGWHISDLVIYDEPRELSEFHYASVLHTNCFGRHTKRVTRPPQSWCYVKGGE